MFYINVHYPMNLDKIFQIFNYANLHLMVPNFFKIIGEGTGVINYSDEDKYYIVD